MTNYNEIKKIIITLYNNEKIIIKDLFEFNFTFKFTEKYFYYKEKIKDEIKEYKIDYNDVYKLKFIECNYNSINSFLLLFKNLKELYIDGHLYPLYIKDNLRSLKKLTIKRSKLYEISKNLINLEELNLNIYSYDYSNSYNDLKEINIKLSLPDTFINLKKIYLNHCENIYYIPETYQNLEKLIIIFCDNINELPNLYKLKKLFLECSNIKYIPKTLINLKHLYLNQCGYIKDIPETLINLKYLENYVFKINSIPKTLINLKTFKSNEEFKISIPNTLIDLKHKKEYNLCIIM